MTSAAPGLPALVAHVPILVVAPSWFVAFTRAGQKSRFRIWYPEDHGGEREGRAWAPERQRRREARAAAAAKGKR